MIAGKTDVALVIAQGIHGTAIQLEDKAPDSLYRVQVGAYTQKSNAEQMKKNLKGAGYDSMIVRE